jgi:hypothetical protein
VHHTANKAETYIPHEKVDSAVRADSRREEVGHQRCDGPVDRYKGQGEQGSRKSGHIRSGRTWRAMMGRGVGHTGGAGSRMVGGRELQTDSQSEKSGWGGAGGALAMAAAMTASISAEVGGLEGEYDLLNDAASSCREMSHAQRSFLSIAARCSTLEPQP